MKVFGAKLEKIKAFLAVTLENKDSKQEKLIEIFVKAIV